MKTINEIDEYDDGEGEDLDCIRKIFDKRLEHFERRKTIFLGGIGVLLGSVLTYFLYKKRQNYQRNNKN